MKARWFIILMFVFALGAGPLSSRADDFPKNANFETLVTFLLPIEGLTGDKDGNLYTTERGGNPCLVKRVNFDTKTVDVIGNIPAPCSPTGIAFDKSGFLLIADSPNIFVLNPLPSGIGPGPTASLFATGVPGTNGIAVDKKGAVWTSDGTTAQGRVWKITDASALNPANCDPSNLVLCEEVFRIQPTAATSIELGINFGDGVTAVGRDPRDLPSGTITVTPISRNAADTAGSQPLVANGLAFNKKGNLFIADTARGAIWMVEFKNDGTVKSRTGCDPVFTANTLCLENVFVTHPLLEGADGIVLDKKDNIWTSVNERNAIVGVSKKKAVTEIFRNQPDGTTHLRNTGPLEFPSSPFLLGKQFCTANFDLGRRDNFPNTAGEISPVTEPRGSISCMDKKVKVEGLPLPVK